MADPWLPDDSRDVAGWICAARAGSNEALGLLLESCGNYLFLIAGKRLEKGLLGKFGPGDVVQETFAEAHRDFGRFRGESEEELKRWLRRILLNTLSNMSRDLKAQKRQADREFSRNDARASGREPTDPAASPSAELIAREEGRRLGWALAQLSEEHRRVILLRHRAGLCFAAIGRAMGRTAEAARKLCGRARADLQRLASPQDLA
jgi:RNA polymerase sigma-70 factor, ECF subfamily